MLRLVRVLAEQPYVTQLCREAQIAVDTWLAIATNDAIDADTATGRGMRTSQTVAALRVNRSERTIRRARAISVRLGLMVELYRGRELSKDERLGLLADSPGHQQRGLPNTYAMTVCGPRQRRRISTPRPGRFAQVLPHVDGFGHLPPEGGLGLTSHLLEILPLAAAGASEEAEPPPAARHRRRARPGTGSAIEVLAHPGLSILLDGVRPGTIAAQLAPYVAGGWRGHALAGELLTVADRLGIGTWEPARSPWALLKVLLTHIDPVAAIHIHAGIPWDTPPADSGQRTPPPEPCGGPDCDGHGWINLVDERGHVSARRCPDCSPAIRAHQPDQSQLDATGDDEPPF